MITQLSLIFHILKIESYFGSGIGYLPLSKDSGYDLSGLLSMLRIRKKIRIISKIKLGQLVDMNFNFLIINQIKFFLKIHLLAE